MEIQFLGSGHAYETPNSDCACDPCYAQRESGDPRDIRGPSSIAVKGRGNEYILVDAGGFRTQKAALREFLGRKPGQSIGDGMNLFITHSHYDHVGDLPDFDSVVREGTAIPTYAHPLCFGRLTDMDFDFLFKFGTLDRRELEMGTTYTAGEFGVRPFKVDHKSPIAPGSVGYVIDSDEKRVVYTGDFREIEDIGSVAGDGRRIDTLLAECNWFNDLEGRVDHMSLQHLLPKVKALDPKELVLYHLGSDDELTTEADRHIAFKKQAIDPLLDKVPRTHAEWDQATREVLSRDPELKRFAAQETILAYDGLTLR